MTSFRKVSLPLTISDMDEDLESKSIYLIDYDSSTLKNQEFLDYIERIGLVADVEFKNTSSNDKFELLKLYMESKYFHHFLSFNIAIMNCIYGLKGFSMRLGHSCLTFEEEIQFTKDNAELLYKWIAFFDSYLMYMVALASNKDQILKDRYPQEMITQERIGSTAVSLFLDDFFYDYFKTKIDEKNVRYWQYMYDNKIYDGKTFNIIILNKANWIFKVLHNTSCEEKWNEFLTKCL